MQWAGLTVADDEGVRAITLNRPQRLNAIDLPMTVALQAALREATADPEVRAILLRGAGRAFCAGDDVEAQGEISRAGERALRDQLAALQEISELLTLGPKPTVAGVKGWAVGAGFSWVLNCDFVVWGASATGVFPELGFGAFVTGGASWLLPRIVGPARANQILYLGNRVKGDEALACGLASSLAADDQVDDAALQVARQIAALPPLAAAQMKRITAAERSEGFGRALSAEVEACVATTLDPATVARMRAALVKGR